MVLMKARRYRPSWAPILPSQTPQTEQIMKTIYRIVVASSIFAICACDNSTTTPNSNPGVQRSAVSIGVSNGHLVDANGFSLYETEAACTGSCLLVWPPMTATTAPTATGTASQAAIGLFGNQVSYAGSLLYYFQSDSAPGETNGSGVGGFTLAVPPPAVATHDATSIGVSLGHLVDAHGYTLYDTEAACTGTCLTVWPPVMATTAPTATGGSSQTAIGLTAGQVTYNGLLLFYFQSDTLPGQVSGNSVNGFAIVTQ